MTHDEPTCSPLFSALLAGGKTSRKALEGVQDVLQILERELGLHSF